MSQAALKVRGPTWTPPGDEEPLWADGSFECSTAGGSTVAGASAVAEEAEEQADR